MSAPGVILRSGREPVIRALRSALATLDPAPPLRVAADERAPPPDPADLVLLDLQDLEEPISAVRRLAPGRPVALVEAPAPDGLVDVLAAGCEDFLFLPLRTAELREVWRRHLEAAAGRNGAAIRFAVPSEVRYCRAAVERIVEACRARAGLDEESAFRLRVAVGEAVANAVLHGNREDPRRRVRVEAEAGSGEARVRVADEGAGFDPEAVPDPTTPGRLERSRGRGLFLIRSLADEVRIRPPGNEVTLTVRRGRREPRPSVRGDESHPAADGAPDLAALLEGFSRVAGRPFRLLIADRDGRARPLLDTLGPAEKGVADTIRRSAPLAGGGRLEAVVPASPDAEGFAAILLGWVGRLLRSQREVDLFSREMLERYEELTLLTSISETLGSHIQVRDAAEVILREVADVVGVRGASLWLEEEGELRPFAAYPRPGATGGDGAGAEQGGGDPGAAAVAADPAQRLLVERIFREQEAVIGGGPDVEGAADGDAEGAADADAGPGDGPSASGEDPSVPLLAVPVGYAPPEGDPRRLGVLSLVGRKGGGAFRAGDLRLMTAVASQIGAAIQNGRLVQESLRRERVLAELEIAHDLQLKMLPSLAGFSDVADVAGRCEPAQSIGGDFYLLARLPAGRLGVMLGDVSSHGISAALIMALTMSAASIYARERERPSDVLLHIHQQLLRELESTEMFMTLFYGVLDPGEPPAGRRTGEVREGTLRWANAGHPYAFRLGTGGRAERLVALNPPIGTAPPSEYGERVRPWRPETDQLLLFTDGLLEGEDGSVEAALLRAAGAAADAGPARVVEALFDRGAEDGPDDRTALAVRLLPAGPG